MRYALHLLALLVALAPVSLSAQAWRLPPSEPNTRYHDDAFPTERPKLSMSGFDRTDGKAHGVKQVIDLAFGVSSGVPDLDTARLFEQIAQDAGGQNTGNPTEHQDITLNVCAPIEVECVVELHAAHVEAQAFVALMAFVISLNDGDRPGEPTLFTDAELDRLNLSSTVFPRFGDDGPIDHVEARDRLMATLRRLDALPDGNREFVAIYDREDRCTCGSSPDGRL